MNHYFTNNPNNPSNSRTFDFQLDGKTYRFSTDSGVFSKDYVDFGTKSLIKAISLKNEPLKVLDLGCGYGVIGIVLKDRFPNIELSQSDINYKATELTKINNEANYITSTVIHSDGFENIHDTFDVITLNPPIRAGKEVIFKLYEGAYTHLNKGGVFYIVIQKKQGAPSHKKQLENIFNNATIINKVKGYYIIKMIKV
ncbi:MAG: methyltransferase [Acholeplasmataceae bacterium]